MTRDELDPRIRKIVYSTYGDNNIDDWEALYYMSEVTTRRLHQLERKYNGSFYGTYLDVIEGTLLEEFLTTKVER